MVGPEGYDPLYDDIDPYCRFYNLNEEQVSYRQYLTERIEKGDNPRRVGSDYIDPEQKIWVSTVFLGMDHQFRLGGPPLIYETMVFDQRDLKPGTVGRDLDMYRYSTREQAEAGHRAVVQEYTVLYEALEGINVEEATGAEVPLGHVGEGKAGSQPPAQPDSSDD